MNKTKLLNAKMQEVCSVRGCEGKAVIWWPLIDGEPCLCHKHYENPTKKFRELVEKSKEPPDDFDIPYPLPRDFFKASK